MRSCLLSVDSLDGIAQPGDLLLYRDSRSIEDTLIGRGGRSPYAHAGMLARKNGRWAVLEMLQWQGGHWRFLEDAVRDDEGRNGTSFARIWKTAGSGGTAARQW